MNENIYIAEEIRYIKGRLEVLLLFTVFSLFFYQQSTGEMEIKSFSLALVLILSTIFSLFHYLIIRKFPDIFLNIRKNILILIDLSVVTYMIYLLDGNGIFLLPIYILLVMRNGFSFGMSYFFTSIVLAGISWIILIQSSAYWAVHTDIIATFAITTFLVPLFSLNFISRIHEENSELSKELVSTEYDASYDVLTGLANRKSYNEYTAELARSKVPFSLLFIDLNKFKFINDTYGHDIGDKTLQEASSRLTHSLDEEDFIARLGDDEFVIITPRKKAFLQKFVNSVEDNVIGKYAVNGVEVKISLSIGISIFPDDAKSLEELERKADEAMYFAKKNHSSHHHFHNIQKLTPSARAMRK